MTYFDTDPLVINATRANAEADSLKAYIDCFDVSPLDPFAVAIAVGKEARLREAESRRQRAKAALRSGNVKAKTPALLGCWVNGELKFQSRDHDAIRNYAAEKMRPWTIRLTDGSYYVKTNDVWVAPVGSFQK